MKRLVIHGDVHPDHFGPVMQLQRMVMIRNSKGIKEALKHPVIKELLRTNVIEMKLPFKLLQKNGPKVKGL